MDGRVQWHRRLREFLPIEMQFSIRRPAPGGKASLSSPNRNRELSPVSVPACEWLERPRGHEARVHARGSRGQNSPQRLQIVSLEEFLARPALPPPRHRDAGGVPGSNRCGFGKHRR